MKRTIFLRNVIAIVICLVATTSVQAQLGGALNRARNTVREATQNATSTVTEKATQAKETATQVASETATEATGSVTATVAPSQHPEKDALYKRCFDLVEVAKNATDYDGKNNPYSGVKLGRDNGIEKKIFSCGDREMAKLDAEMIALEKKLWEMYNSLKAAGKTPQYEPVEFKGCGQVLDDRAAWEQAEASGLGFPIGNDIKSMPQTYTIAADVVKKIEELCPRKPFVERVEKAGGKVVRYLYTSNTWREGTYKHEEWPHPELKLRAKTFAILVKMPNEDFYRLYSDGEFYQYYDRGGNLRDNRASVNELGGNYSKIKM